MNQNQQQQMQLVQVNLNHLQEKFKSKKELYLFLQQDCRAFLPKIQSTNIYFLKQILRREKEYLDRDNVKVSAIPHIEGLTVEDLIQYASTKQELLKYLPDQQDWLHIDRSWICDLLYTLDHDQMQDKINEAILKRQQKLEQTRDLIIEMRPEFVQALNGCIKFSQEKGRSVNLLKQSSKRKRRRSEIEDVKEEEEEELKQDKQSFLKKFKKFKQDLQNLSEQNFQLEQANQEMIQLFKEDEQPSESQQFNI